MKFILSIFVCFSSFAMAQTKWPEPPSDRNNPGSASYDFSLFKESYKVSGRTINFFAPAEVKDQNRKAPLIVFGHGQAIGIAGYDKTFEHLAKKGIAIAFVEYDTGFFDQDWARMSQDFKSLGDQAVTHFADYVNPDWIIYSGHSKGGYIALMAAGLPETKVKSVVLMAPAGYDPELLKRIPVSVPVTLIYGEADSIIKYSAIKEIYDRLKVDKKQIIRMKSYPSVSPELAADHFVPLNKKYIFGGRDGLSPFHYYGTWKWLFGAVEDVKQGSPVTNTYIYGSETATTGLGSFNHEVIKNW